MEKHRYQLGLSLIEASMVLALAAVVVAGVMFYYQSASDSNKKADLTSVIMSVNGYLSGIYNGATDSEEFKGADIVLEKSSVLPEKFKTHKKNSYGIYMFKTPFNTTFTVGAGDSGMIGLKYEFDDLSKDLCIFLGSQNFGSTFSNEWINGNDFLVSDRSATPAEAAKWCSKDSNANSVTFYTRV